MSKRHVRDKCLIMSGAILLWLAGGCIEKDEFVVINGTVRDAGTGETLYGVRVSLLDTEFEDNVATGTDGEYRLIVPKGSKLYLETDDFDPAPDNFFPMINVDSPVAVATEDIYDWNIHACPRTYCPVDGLTSDWNVYLQNQDAANGDLFVPTNIDSSGGVVWVSFWFCEGGATSSYHAGMSAASDTPAFPIGVMKCVTGSVCDSSAVLFYHPPQTVTDWWGNILSFGDPAFTGKYVHFTITDTDPDRGLDFHEMEIPVRHGAVTFLIAGAVDGVANKNLKDILECLNPSAAGNVVVRKVGGR